MKKNFSITPVEDEKNEMEITFLKDLKLKVNKKDTIFVKFLMILLERVGGAAIYFAPLFGFTTKSFNDIKENFDTQGIISLFYPEIKKQEKDKKVTNSDIGKIVSLIVKNPDGTNKQITDKFNCTSSVKIDIKDVEGIREKFGLKI
ncbi:MAG: hypothetical protein ABIF11_01275 [Nitrospirota bacterium]